MIIEIVKNQDVSISCDARNVELLIFPDIYVSEWNTYISQG